MDESSRTPESTASAHDGDAPQTFYLGYQRDGKWQWRALTAGMGDEDVRAVFFVKPGGKEWPAIPDMPEDANGISGFKRKKPPASSIADTPQTGTAEATGASASSQSVCYWIDGRLYCDHDS